MRRWTSRPQGRGRRGDFGPSSGGNDALADGGTAQLLTPHRNEHMERVVLASLILWAEQAWPYVEGKVAPDDFFDSRHRVIFQAIEAVFAAGKSLDMHSLTAALGPHLDAVGGSTYLGDLCAQVPSVAFVETYVRDLVEAGTVRALQSVAIDTLLAVPDRPADEVLTIAAGMQTALDRRGGGDAMVDASTVVVEIFTRIEKGSGTRGRVGRTYGLEAVDRITGGSTDGQLIIGAARPAMGKTSFATGKMVAMARESRDRREEGVYLFFSLEMPRMEIGQRCICQMARVDESKVRQVLLSQDETNALQGSAQEFANLPIYIDDQSRSIQAVRSACFKARMRHGKVLGVVIDYLQLMRDDVVARNKNSNRENELSSVSRELKALAKQLGCPVFALAQLNRDCEKRGDKRPMLSDLRDTGAIEQDADVVMFFYRDEVYNKKTEDRGIAEIIIGKQRHGPTDTARVRFIAPLTRFEDLARSDEPWHGDTHASGDDPCGDGGAGGAGGADDALPPFED